MNTLIKTRAGLLLLLALLCGCTPDSEGATTKKGAAANTLAAYVDVINYNHDHNYGFTLIDLTVNPVQAISGGAVWPLASGGSANCCIQLPKKWRAGLKVSVKWDDYIKHDLQGSHERELEIPRYARPGNLYVVFGPEQQPELVVSLVEPGHPDWPGKIKQTPWDFCVATSGRKACKAAMPKRFDAVSSQGLCTYMKKENFPESDANCEFAIVECIRDYEDEAFCKETLWGEPRK